MFKNTLILIFVLFLSSNVFGSDKNPDMKKQLKEVAANADDAKKQPKAGAIKGKSKAGAVKRELKAGSAKGKSNTGAVNVNTNDDTQQIKQCNPQKIINNPEKGVCYQGRRTPICRPTKEKLLVYLKDSRLCN